MNVNVLRIAVVITLISHYNYINIRCKLLIFTTISHHHDIISSYLLHRAVTAAYYDAPLMCNYLHDIHTVQGHVILVMLHLVTAIQPTRSIVLHFSCM